MSRKFIDIIIAGIAISAVSYGSWQGYNLQSQRHLYSNRGKNAPPTIMEESCDELYSPKTSEIVISPQTCTSSTAIDNLTAMIKESCTYSFYTKKKSYLNVCTATPALDCSQITHDHPPSQRACIPSTICTEIKKLKDGFREACALSISYDDDPLLHWIKQERDQKLIESGSVSCENWKCNRIEKCYNEECIFCGEAQIRSLPCAPP